jgi:hypothetical protein
MPITGIGFCAENANRCGSVIHEGTEDYTRKKTHREPRLPSDSTLVEERRKIMDAWSRYCGG